MRFLIGLICSFAVLELGLSIAASGAVNAASINVCGTLQALTRPNAPQQEGAGSVTIDGRTYRLSSALSSNGTNTIAAGVAIGARVCLAGELVGTTTDLLNNFVLAPADVTCGVITQLTAPTATTAGSLVLKGTAATNITIPAGTADTGGTAGQWANSNYACIAFTKNANANIFAGFVQPGQPGYIPEPSSTFVYCGIVKANSITSGAGSGPRVLELQASTGPGGTEQRFSAPDSITLPTIGSYICGQFEQGAPAMGLVALLRPGDPGYVAQPGAATSAPVATSAPPATSASPATTPPPQTGFTLGFMELFLGLAVFAAVALVIMRNRRSPVAG